LKEKMLHLVKERISLLIILLINSLFIVKYSPDKILYKSIAVFVYSIIILAGIYFLNKRPVLKHSKLLLTLGFAGTIAGILFLLFKIDPYSVNVDRWSAIHNFNEKLLQGEFPYDATTHRGQRSSGLPLLFILVLPFQLIGDVGYFQCFAVAAFFFLLFKLQGKNNNKLILAFVLLLSPALWWEFSVRSDMFSNLLLFSIFLFFCEQHRNKKTLSKIIITGIILGFFGGTRGILVLPFLVYFISYFNYKTERKYIIALLATATIVLIAGILPFVLWDLEQIKTNNPLILQTNKLHPIYMLLAILGAVLIGLKKQTFYSATFYSGLIIFLMIGINFIIQISIYSWQNVIYNDLSDISYLSMAIPFLLFSIIKTKRIS